MSAGPIPDGGERPERGRYGPRRPRPGLTPAAVVAAGRALIERDGLDALTMRAVAAELNTAAPSLYRHVADRDALLLAILEDIAAGLPVDVGGRTPRSRLRRRFVLFHDFMAEHIWVLHVLVAGSLVAENALPFNEACIADFVAGGLPLPAADRAYRSCWQYTLGELLDTHPLGPLTHPTQREQAMQAADPAVLPLTAALYAERQRPDAAGRAHAYERAIDLLVAAQLATAPSRVSHGRSPGARRTGARRS